MTDHNWDFERDPFFLINDLARMTSARFDDWARDHHLTYAQCMTLRRLRDQPGACQNDIAFAYKLEPITISRQLDRLELFGHIERRHDANDRRVRRLHVLPKGDRLLAIIENYWDQLDDVLIGALSTKECENLMCVLLHIKNKLADRRTSGAAIGTGIS
jgi:MarR family transcriptional regulator, transcriptional regulator for hemolysin